MNKELSWIENGYRIFAYEGPQGLKIERLAKVTNKNKSSFYHFFGDLEIFTTQLLEYHLAQTHIVAEKEAASTNQEELTRIFTEHKIDLLFNRQLRIHRDNPDFRKCFLKTNEISLPGLLPVWRKIIGLEENNYLAKMVLMLSIENFFLQITDDSLNPNWLSEYFSNIKTMVSLFKKNHTTRPNATHPGFPSETSPSQEGNFTGSMD